MKINKPLFFVFILTLLIAGIYLACTNKIACPFKKDPKKYKVYTFDEYLLKYDTNNVVYASPYDNGECFLRMLIGMNGTNVIYQFLGRNISRDQLMHITKKHYNDFYPFTVIIDVCPHVPLGLLHDLNQDIKQIGINNVKCFIMGAERTNRKIEFSDEDKQLIIDPYAS